MQNTCRIKTMETLQSTTLLKPQILSTEQLQQSQHWRRRQGKNPLPKTKWNTSQKLICCRIRTQQRTAHRQIHHSHRTQHLKYRSSHVSMQQYRLSLVQRQHGTRIKITQQNGKKKIKISLTQNHRTSQHHRPTSLQIASHARSSHALRQNSRTLTKKINHQSLRLPQNRVNIIKSKPHDQLVHSQDIKILQNDIRVIINMNWLHLDSA